jgi:two-component system nitrogen regulation sensor histidine kinase NtrY
MVEELEVAKREVEDQSRTLERMVEERTRALRDSEARLLEVKNRLATILSNVAAGVVSIDEDGCITTFNERAGEILGVSASDSIGRSLVDAVAGGDRGRFTDFVTSAQAGAQSPAMDQIRLRLGEATRTLSVVSSPLVAAGVRQGTVVVFHDLTQILATQRLEAWKEAVERVIHEIKNPLTPVGLAAQTLRAAHAADPSRFEEIFPSATQMILDSVRDLKALIAEFTQFSRLPKVVLARVDVNQVVRDVAAPYAGEGPIRIVLDLAPGEIAIEADLAQFRRVLINVVNNAVEAMEDRSGAITVATRESDVAGHVAISVTDQGCGVEDVERIFEPYYTTKVKGTGLGLAIARQIVEEHGGTITAKSEVGVGTTVSVHLATGVP